MILNDGLTEDQAQVLMSKIGSTSFIQNRFENHLNLNNKDKIKNKINEKSKIMKSNERLKMKSKTTSEFIMKLKDFCLNTDGTCDDSILKNELNIILDSLN